MQYYMNSTEEYDNLNAQNVTIDIKEGNAYNLTLLTTICRFVHEFKLRPQGEGELTWKSKGTKENAYCRNGLV